MTRSESLRERLVRLRSKTAKTAKRGAGTGASSRASRDGGSELDSAPRKKSFFDDNEHTQATLVEAPENALPNMHFPGVDTGRPATRASVLTVARRLAGAYLFPQLGVGVGTGLLSQTSKTARISRQYPHVLVQDQLYAVFGGQQTLVDRLVCELVADGDLRVLDMNYENFGFTVLVPGDEFLRTTTANFRESEAPLRDRYVELLAADPAATQIAASDLLDADIGFSTLISRGLICISAAEAGGTGVYNITLPHLGGLLRVVKSSCKWIAALTAKTREHMVLASVLRERWFRPYVPPKTQTKKPSDADAHAAFKREYYTTDRIGTAQHKPDATGPGVNIVKFRGVGLDWVLALMVGAGLLESYESPVGLVYRSTGKALE